ncbi:MAG TPA: lysylphosphatidylglycerol synthase transmembrane domain-containing protein [Bacteroidota bacterium]|nr:lysylphosphatidylglycerol synthase transmembrane domain-containing protein [Bacteroidota bacterium]
MRDISKKILRPALSLLLSALFLYLAFRDTDFGGLMDALSRANYWWAFSMLPVLLLSHAVRALRWRYLLRPVKSVIGFRNLFSAMMVGYMMNNVLPRAGELVRPYAINKLEGISRSTAFGTVFIERIFDICSFLLVIAVIPVITTSPLTQAFPWLESAGIWLTAGTLTMLALFSFLMVRRDLVVRILGMITRKLSSRRAELVEHVAHSFLDGFLFLKEPRHYLTIVALSAVIWGLYILMMYLPFYAFDLPGLYRLDLGSAVVLQAISSIGYIMPTPGATGPYHYFTIQTLTRLYKVSDELAASYAALTHAIGYVGVTMIGLFYFFRDQLHMSEVLKPEPAGTPAADSEAGS